MDQRHVVPLDLARPLVAAQLADRLHDGEQTAGGARVGVDRSAEVTMSAPPASEIRQQSSSVSGSAMGLARRTSST